MLAVQTQTNAEREDANADLTRSMATVQDRDNVPVDAIKTLHPGVARNPIRRSRSPMALRSAVESASNFTASAGCCSGRRRT